MLNRTMAIVAAGLAICLTVAAPGQYPENRAITEMLPDGTVLVDGVPFPSWNEYFASDFARQRGARCGTPKKLINLLEQGRAAGGGSQADCSYTLTNPDPQYDPANVYRIPVVVHELRDTNGNGTLTQQLIDSQIDVLNEDFLALMGTNGAGGENVQVDFYLAGHDVTVNNTWFNDSGSYWDTLNWDPTQYMNIYTNTASGALGYVPGLPQTGTAGASYDRVVIFYDAFGRFSAATNYDLGRTATHEVGHYLGLFHVFDGCDGGSCNSAGDLVCDTPSQDDPNFFCDVGTTCSTPDGVGNHMDYNYDICLYGFSPIQANRMRCTLENWRPLLYEDLGGCEVTVDCNFNCIEDAMELSGGTAQDCNGNFILDSCEIAAATVDDCDLNGVPDSCEDCNSNGIGDACEFSGIFTDDSPVFPSFGATLTPEDYDHTIVAPPAPIGNVTFSFSANGLLAGTSIVMVTLNGNSLEDAFLTTGVNCPVVSEDEITISSALFLSHTGGGNAIIGMRTWNYLINACGDDTWITVSTSYNVDDGSVDANMNGVPDECDLARGDSDLDGTVGIIDFLAVLAEWGVCGVPCPEDADLDGSVGILDFLTVLANWG